MTINLGERYSAAYASGIPLIGAHRGNSAEYPENTMAAFCSAIDLGVDIIECDVHLSADGELVVIHDSTLDRTTNGHGPVMDHNWSELQQLDAGGGERLPRLSEVCELARRQVLLFIELKKFPDRYPGLEERVMELVKALDMLDQVCVASFNHPSVRRIRELEPRLGVGIIEDSRPVDPVSMLRESDAMIFSPNCNMVDPELVNAVHRSGRFVASWTADDRRIIEWCRHCKVDSIHTNRPRDVIPVLRGE